MEIIYTAPPDEKVNDFVKQISEECANRSNKDSFKRYDVVVGLANALKVLRQIQARKLNQNSQR
jgi:hypothetical protein